MMTRYLGMLVVVFCTLLLVAPATIYADAVHADTEALPKMSSSTGNALNRVYDQIEAGKVNSAKTALMALLSEVGDEVPDRQYVERALGYVFLELEQADKARQYFEQSLKVRAFPKEVLQSVSLDLAQLYLAAGNPKKAVAVLQPIEKTTPRSLQLCKILGVSYLESGNARQALPYLEQALSLSKTIERPIAMTLASVYTELGKYREASALLEKLLALWPEDVVLWRQVAQTLYLSGKKEKAASRYYVAYEKGLLKREDELLFLAQLNAEAGSANLALTILEDNLKSKKIASRSDTLLMVAQLHVSARNHRKAAQVFEQVYRVDSNKVSALLNAAHYYVEANSRDDAARNARKILSLKDQKGASLGTQKKQARQLLSYLDQLKELDVLKK